MSPYCYLLNNVKNPITIAQNDPAKYYNYPSTHAEMGAVHKIRRFKNLPKKVDLCVFRITNTGVLGNSKPCFHCVDIMRRSSVNICNVIYSTADGSFCKMKLSELKDSYISRGMRK